jgi:beta-galactosidase
MPLSVTITNHYNFLSLDSFDILFEITSNGKIIQSGILPSLALKPGKTENIQIPVAKIDTAGKDICLNLYAHLKKSTFWAEEGYCVARDQFVLNTAMSEKIKSTGEGLTVKESRNELAVQSDSFKVVFNKGTGALISWKQNGSELMNGVLEPYFWKPANDNQRHSKYDETMGKWRNAAASRVIEHVDIEKQNGIVSLNFKMKLPAIGAAYSLKYSINSRGLIQVEAVYKPGNDTIPKIPKFGMRMRIQDKFNFLTWYGRGPFENYPDRKTAALIGLYESKLVNFITNYAVPQDNANRCDVRWFSMGDQKGNFIKVSGLQPLCFRAWPYSEEDLEKAGHPFELANRDFINLNIDLNIHGVGGDDSWGAPTMEKYTNDGNKPYSFGFILEYQQK